jgi:hypothetical protein
MGSYTVTKLSVSLCVFDAPLVAVPGNLYQAAVPGFDFDMGSPFCRLPPCTLHRP